VTDPTSSALPDLPSAGELVELVELVERLDGENERLRQRVLEVMEWMEESVSAAVRRELADEAWRRQAENLAAELDAVHATLSWRVTAPLRIVASRLRTAGPSPAPSPGSPSDPSSKRVSTPVFVIVRDRLTALRRLIDWLERAGHDEIWLVDNDSTFPPLVEFLNETPHHVVRLGHNLGHRSPFLSGTVQRVAADRHFVVTDPDVVPDDDCPLDAVDHFRELLDRHPEIDKVGFGLRIDDLPDTYPLAPAVRAWEARFWTNEVEPGVYRADIDTTFALYRPLHRRHREDSALRTGAPYVARHLPWYLGPDDLGDEDRWYRQHGEPTTFNWDREELPRWKRRWLSANEANLPDDR
jgi:hypothetical protein